MAVRSFRAHLTAAPLAQVVPRFTAELAKMKIDEVASLLQAMNTGAMSPGGMNTGTSAGAVQERAEKNGGTLDEIASAILALPGGGHRLHDVERTVVVHALARTKGNVSAAARLLGTDRKALERRIERHKISVRRGDRG